MTKPRLGVVLFQLGGPDSPEAVEPFLYNLFCDPDIINFMGAWLARRPLAWWIAHRRAAIVREHYDAIGGQSPIRELTGRQARGLESALASDFDARCFIAMRYWHQLTQEAVEAVRSTALDSPFEKLVLLPLYPQYSFATTLSSLKEWRRVSGQPNGGPKERTVGQFYNHPLYIQAVVQRIGSILRQFPDSSRIHLVFSAHGLPMSLVEKGDPYPQQIETTVRLVCEAGSQQYPGWPRTHLLCYQSRVGPSKWLQPPLTGTIERLGHEGVKEMLVVPISFVTEHIETLHEVNIEAREEAKKLGIERFRMMPAVGDSPLFIAALKDLVLRAVGIDTELASLQPSAAV
jgi:ferrochelatase